MGTTTLIPTFDAPELLSPDGGALDQLAAEFMRKAENLDQAIKPLGRFPLLDTSNALLVKGSDGASASWVLTPIEADPQLGVDRPLLPRNVLRGLEQLADADLTFTELFVAHEISPVVIERTLPSTLQEPSSTAVVGPGSGQRPRPVAIDLELAARLIGTTPESPESAALAKHLGERSTRLSDMRRSVFRTVLDGAHAAVVGTSKAARALGSTIGSLPLLDPVLIGAATVHPDARSGAPAIYFELARWEW